MFRVPSEALAERARAWFPLGVHIIEGLFQTVRRMDELSRQRESLIALGTLAAGLAHEINNPAAAAVRAVDALRSTCDTLLSSLVQMVEGSLSADQLRGIDALRNEIDADARNGTPLEIADREERLTEWLDAHAVEDGWRLAPVLAAAGVDVGWCERAAGLVTDDTLSPGLEWVAGTLSTTALLAEVKEATGRISELVAAVKSYSQVDRASWQLIDVTEGIESTLVMLGHKLRGGVTVVREYDADVPRLEANPGELNQVWTNLIDNAVDAMGGAGTLRVSARGRRRRGRRRDRGHRHRHAARRAGPCLRSVLHDEGSGQGHGPRSRHLAADRRAPRRPDQRSSRHRATRWYAFTSRCGTRNRREPHGSSGPVAHAGGV